MGKPRRAHAIDDVTLERLRSLVEERRRTADGAYPVRLSVLLDEAGLPATLAASIPRATKVRKYLALTVTSKASPASALAALVASAEDAATLVGRDALLIAQVERARTASNPASSLGKLAEMKDGLPEKLRKPFKAYWKQAIESGRLPAVLGSLRFRSDYVLFFLSDVTPARRRGAVEGIPEPSASEAAGPRPVEPRVHADVASPRASERILAAFDALDAASGNRNFVSLFELRRRLQDMSRDQFDAALNQLRRNWTLTLDPAEGRHGTLAPELLEAGIQEESMRLVYAARRPA
jgi:hypothetical protein